MVHFHVPANTHVTVYTGGCNYLNVVTLEENKTKGYSRGQQIKYIKVKP